MKPHGSAWSRLARIPGEIGMRRANIHRLYALLGSSFRRSRMRTFCRALDIGSETSVVDLGGTGATWQSPGLPSRVTTVNLDGRDSGADVVADACLCPFRDRSFDVVFSNSLIEHLGTRERQEEFAREVQRLGRRGYFVQTPNRWFPIEPHYLAPLVQFVPRCARPFVIRWLTPWGWLEGPSPSECRRRVEEIRLLGRGEIERLFPGATVVRERFLGLTKSLVALRRVDRGAGPTRGARLPPASRPADRGAGAAGC